MASQIEELENEMQGMRNNTVNLNRAMEDIKNIETNIENMKDKIRNNGNHQ
jgi:prefoldin subunit 5